MRGSFGGPFHPFGGGRGMLGAATTVVARTGVAGGLAESLSASTTNSAPTSPRATSSSGHSHRISSVLSLSSSTSPLAAPMTGSVIWPSSQYDDYFRVSADGDEDYRETQNAHFQEFLLGLAPSSDEVHSAVSALQQIFDPSTELQFVRDRLGPNLNIDEDHVSSVGSDLDWIEPPLHLYNSRTVERFGYGSESDSETESVVDALRLLRTDPSVQEMVASLSQDKAVWGAVMNNEVVRELIEECHAIAGLFEVELATKAYPDNDDTSEETSDETHTVIDTMRQVINQAKITVMEMMDRITQVVSDLFKLLGTHVPVMENEKSSAGVAVDSVEGKLRASFMLCIVVLLIVVVSRARGAS